jgi:hypothetical protein
VTVTRCWLDAPCGVHVDAAARFRVFANDFYGAAPSGARSSRRVVTKSGPLPEDGRIARNYFSQLKDIGAGARARAATRATGCRTRTATRRGRTTATCEHGVLRELHPSQRKYLVYHKHAMTVLRNKIVSVAKNGDHEGTGNAYHVLASRGGNWCGGRWAYNVCRAGPNAHCDVQGWDGVAEHNDFGGVVVNVWCGMDQKDGKSLLGANAWTFTATRAASTRSGRRATAPTGSQWPLEGVSWEGEVGASWRWEGSAPEGSSYKPSGGPEVPWGADGTNSQKLVYREGNTDKTAVAWARCAGWPRPISSGRGCRWRTTWTRATRGSRTGGCLARETDGRGRIVTEHTKSCLMGFDLPLDRVPSDIDSRVGFTLGVWARARGLGGRRG